MEEGCDGGVIGQHEARHPVSGGDVGRLARQRHLDGGRAPRDEPCHLALADPLQGLVHLGGVNLALENI